MIYAQGFLIRVVPTHPHINLPLRDETILLMQRASLYFTLGLRLLYGTVPLLFYAATGPLSLLIATFILILCLFFLDTVPARQVSHLLRTSTMTTVDAMEAGVKSQQYTQQQQQQSVPENGVSSGGGADSGGMIYHQASSVSASRNDIDALRRSAESRQDVRWHVNV